MRRGSWSPTYKKTNTYNLEHYLIRHFREMPLRNLSTFEIQVWLNNLVEEKDYSDPVVRTCFNNIRAITIWQEAKVSCRSLAPFAVAAECYAMKTVRSQ
jgi:hypothetical protein